MYLALALLAAIIVSLAFPSKTNDPTLQAPLVATPNTTDAVTSIPSTPPTTIGPVPARMHNWTPVPFTSTQAHSTTFGPVPASSTRMPNSATTLAIPAPTKPDITRRMKRTTEYACSKCSDLGAQMCCAGCNDNQQLAVRRAAPFNTYAAEEVLCTGCDEIMNRPTPTMCTIDKDGRFSCSKETKCTADLTFTYEDIR
jgi:hypothetical protein